MGNVFIPQDGLPHISPSLSRAKHWRTALDQRAEYRTAVLEAEKQNIILKYSRNQLLPRLDLQATLSWNGLDDQYTSAYERVGERQGYDAQVGIQFSIPLGNLQARANRDASVHRCQQALYNIRRTELQISTELDTVLARIRAAKAKMQSARESTRLGEQLVETAQKRLREGVGSASDLLRSRTLLADARSRQLAAHAEYNQTSTQLYLVTGSLLEQYDIRIQQDDKGQQLQAIKAQPASSGRPVPR
jgi:outer membrane protein